MPYPTKTTIPAIVTAAITQLEVLGDADFSMRTLARALGITPRALYRYFSTRALLEAAITEVSFGELLDAMRHVVAGQSPLTAVAAAAHAYLAFAATHPARYHLMLSAPHDPTRKSRAQEAVWEFVLEMLAQVIGAEHSADAALALWAMLHGFVALAAAGVANGQDQSEQGLAIFLAGLASRTET